MILCSSERDVRPNPAHVRALLQFGGRHKFGGPNYRLAWGWSRGDWILGEFVSRYRIPERHLERFHIERWVPPEMYGSPLEWYRLAYQDIGGVSLNVLGEFPDKGDYEHMGTLEDFRTKEPLNLYIDDFVELVRMNERIRDRRPWEIKKQIDARQEQKQKEIDRRKNEVLDSMEAAFPLKTWMPVSGCTTATSRRVVNL